MTRKSSRIQLYVPDDALGQIDQAAEKAGVSRSEYMVQSALWRITDGQKGVATKAAIRKIMEIARRAVP